MPKLLFLKIVLFLTISGAAQAQEIEAFLCIPNAATGFHYNEKNNEWETTSFNVDHKYLIIRAPLDYLGPWAGSAWIVKKFGENDVFMGCENDFNEPGFLFCEGFVADISFNRFNLRYLYSYMVGYYNSATPTNAKEGRDTPVVEIGTCSPL